MTKTCSYLLRRAAIGLLPVITLLLLTSPVAWAHSDQTNDARTVDARGDEATRYPIGVYITSLRDFDTVGDSFGIDFWIWSVHPPGDNPLNSIGYVNAKQLETRLEQTTRRDDREWSRLKARAIVLHDWNVRNFPFDRQTLTIDLGIADSGVRNFGADRAGSGFGGDIVPDGWRVADFEIERRTVEDAASLGDPAYLGGTAQEHLFVSVALERESAIGFFKLVAGVYAAIAIALLSFLMAPDQATVFSGRMAVLVGALFATVVNMQVSNTVLGSLEGVSLVDKIHIIALVYVFAAALMAVVSRWGYDAGHKDRARRRDTISLIVFGGSFLIINLLLILQAAVSG